MAVQILCPELEDIENGSVEVTRYSRTYYYASYTCDVGYQRNGSWYRDCDLFTGEWDGTAPTCVECKLSTIPITTIQPLIIIMLIYSTHYLQHLSIVDILEMLPMEQWMSLKGLNYVQLLGTHVMKDS